MAKRKFTGNPKKLSVYLLSAVCLLAVWYAGAELLHAPLILPMPGDVIRSLVLLCGTAPFWSNVVATMARCFAAFGIAVICGSALGILCGLFPSFRRFLSVPLVIIRSTPVVSFILLALFWFSSSIVPVFVAVLMTLPLIVTSVASGFAHIDGKLLAMAHSYGFSEKQIFRYITIPAVFPFFLSGTVSSFGLSWKVVAAGEVLSLPHLGTGTLLQTAQVHLETEQVLAITIVIVALSFFFEQLFSFVAGKITKNRTKLNIGESDE